VVSEGELRRALAAGVAPEKIVFSGVGKTDTEIAFGLDAGIGQFNVESEPELEAISAIGAASSQSAKVALRVNPDVDAMTHDKIATGRGEDKFGIPFRDVPRLYARAAALPGIEPVGLAVHIGSQLTSLEPFRKAFTRIAQLVRALRADGQVVRRIDLGGGLGIVYDSEEPPHPDDYAAMVRETVGDLGCDLMFEPGRLLAGNAGVLVTRVVYIKDGESRRFAIVDAAMNDLLRPSLYDAHHGVAPVTEIVPGATPATVPTEVVGPVCETGDVLARSRDLPGLAAGDLLAILSAGAYGAVMSSAYNTRPIAPEIMVNGGHYSVIRPRQTYDILLNQDRMPDWLDDAAEVPR